MDFSYWITNDLHVAESESVLIHHLTWPIIKSDTVDHSLSFLKVSSCGLQDTALFRFSLFSLVALSRSLLRMCLNLLYQESLDCPRAKTSDSSLPTLTIFQSHLFHSFKNHFSIENSQKNISIPDFSQFKILSLSYLICFSNLASPKSHSYPCFQICFSARLLHIHTLICSGPNPWSQSLILS